MPNYEFRCRECNKIFEFKCSVDELPLIRPDICDECDGHIIQIFTTSSPIWNCNGSYKRGDVF